MNIPEEVRIGSCYYDVEFTDETLAVDGTEVMGLIEYHNHLIKIRTKLGDIQQREHTFLHELVHGIVRDRSIELGEQEEFVVDEIAKGLHQVILDNPCIFEKEIELKEGD